MSFGTVEEYVQAATAAGLSVYGHTLAWHAQQPIKWLNAILADKPLPVDPNAPTVDTWVEQITNGNCEGGEATNFVVREPGNPDVNRIDDGVGVDGSRGIQVHSVDNPTNDWDTQFFIYTPDHVWQSGDEYEFTMKIRADRDASVSLQAHDTPGAYIHWAMLAGSYNFTTEWQTVTFKGEISGDQAGGGGMRTIAFNLNVDKAANTYYFDDMSWKALVKASGPVTFMEDLITNGDMEGTDNRNFISKEAMNGGGTYNSPILDGIGKDGSRGVQVISSAGAAQDWDTQFWILLPEALQAGTKCHVEFDYKASMPASADTQAHADPGAYQHWACIGSPSFTTEWQHYTRDVTISSEMAGGAGMKSVAFNLSKDKANDVTFYFDNIVFEVEKESASGGIPQTDEEKRDTLMWAMDRWVNGMMNACKNEEGTEVLVKAWDVVNEAISGGNPDSEGVYALQHNNGSATDFFWQDYLGDIDYVRTVVGLARKYGGNDLKLFVNDYNLESDWDQNGKLKSLIKWIERWEADGVTKIDGIGSQMHISCYMNPQTQESKKKAIENSFKLMAATGKLVRISELDMGLVDENGNDVQTPDVTEEQHHAMADYYKWIIQKYFEIIPVAQQWGICQWCATDSPAGSGWRANSPVGLWDVNYYRKHTYAGFADGLSGK
ncbi:MAG: endo-1,4-beta-xylanase [Prevotella sp.]|nr:endo-1,4-beta-xylanase [Prevotella sp.]